MGVSHSQCARESGLAQNSVSRIARGEQEPTASVVEILREWSGGFITARDLMNVDRYRVYRARAAAPVHSSGPDDAHAAANR